MCNAGVQALMGSSHCLINRMKPISSKFHAGLDETRWRAVTEAAVKERLVGAQDEPEPIGPPSPTSGLTRSIEEPHGTHCNQFST